MTRADRATWAKRVERWKQGGLSAEQYAGEIGVNPRTLSYWRWRLGAGARRQVARKSPVEIAKARLHQPPPSQALARPRAAAQSVALSFIEVSREQAGLAADPFEVVLVNGLRVRVPPSFDAGALGRLLDVVERRQ